MAKVYQFQEQLKKGKEIEQRLDLYFADEFTTILPAIMSQERRGIDRLFIRDGRWWTVEFKADFKTVTTGNSYIEVVSVGKYDEHGDFVIHKEGWALTSCADVLVYYPVGTGLLYILDPSNLKRLVARNTENRALGNVCYRSVSVQNNGYQGRGLLVPIDEIREMSETREIEE